MKHFSSIQVLEKDLAEAPDTKLTSLARDIIDGARELYFENAENLKNHQEYKVKRDFENPQEYTHDSVLGIPDIENILPTNTGIEYKFNDKGHAINPYMNTGLTGRGLLWQYGPNHAIDNGILYIKDDLLYAMGIFRKDSGQRPALSGGFAKFKKTEDGYVLDEEALLETRVEEFFEEMISGSITLLPEYETKVTKAYNDEVDRRMQTRDHNLEKYKLDEIREQVTTQLKMQQVQDIAPRFFTRAKEILAQSTECFAGPILSDRRNTNNAWIETRLSWLLLSDAKWNYIKGINPKFNYKFAAGDDADSVRLFKVDADLIQSSNASHSSMFAFMIASFVLDSQKQGTKLSTETKQQIKSIAALKV